MSCHSTAAATEQLPAPPAERGEEETSPFVSPDSLSYTLEPDLHRSPSLPPSLPALPEGAELLPPKALSLPRVRTPRASDSAEPEAATPSAAGLRSADAGQVAY